MLLGELWFVMFCQCYVTVTMFCNNVSILFLHMIVTDYVLIGEITGNKYPVLLLLLFKYLGAILTENGDLDAEMAGAFMQYNRNGKTGREGTGCVVWSKNKFEGQGESSSLYKTVVRRAMMYDAGTCALKKAREAVGCGGNVVTKLARIINERNRGTTKVGEISKKVQESRLK